MIVGIPASETLAVPDTVGVATVVAMIDTEVSAGILLGAVYVPEVVIVPTLALPPMMPFTDQVTA